MVSEGIICGYFLEFENSTGLVLSVLRTSFSWGHECLDDNKSFLQGLSGLKESWSAAINNCDVGIEMQVTILHMKAQGIDINTEQEGT